MSINNSGDIEYSTMLRPGLLLAALALTRAEHSVLVRGRAGVPIYSPQPHLLAPTAAQQRRLERFGGVGLRPKAERVHHPENEVFFRQYPVEETFFRSFAPAPCTLIAEQVPPSDVKCDHAPKYSCGPLSALRRIDGCQVWSVGSNSQTCFERFVHAQAPNCAIHTFDPRSALGPRGSCAPGCRLRRCTSTACLAPIRTTATCGTGTRADRNHTRPHGCARCARSCDSSTRRGGIISR